MHASLRNRRWEEFAASYRKLDAEGILDGCAPTRLYILIAGEWMYVDEFDLTPHEVDRNFMHFGTGSADVVVRARDIQALRWVHDDR